MIVDYRYVKCKDEKIPKKLKELIEKAREVYHDQKMIGFIFEHTESLDHYHTIIDALRLLADPGFVEWVAEEVVAK
ncbi:MAG: hypothetical protein J7K23_00940 [Thermoproteales archaeon]|nr:hypothetical protein [Thermoproteales archaeon]